eukprot:3228320-Prymnesium_polylepis.1
MLAQIQKGGGGLRSAADRSVPDRPAPAGDERSQLLDAIRGAGKGGLKKVDMNQVRAQKQQAAHSAQVKAGGLVNEMLKRRQAMEDDDDDDDDWDDDD